jgi:adenine deaminase
MPQTEHKVCVAQAVGTACNDGNANTVGDTCHAGGVCAGVPKQVQKLDYLHPDDDEEDGDGVSEYEISGHVVDVVNKEIFCGTVAVRDGKIAAIVRDAVCKYEGYYIMPGFIDAHVHIESSMVVPTEFARLATPHGTIGTISDPHEIANVLGTNGVQFMIEEGKRVPFYFNFGGPSCVPALPDLESSGAEFGLEETEELMDNPDIRFLSEMMNFPGITGDMYNVPPAYPPSPEVVGKVAIARARNKPIDGHAPGLTGPFLSVYASHGMSTEHECLTLQEAKEKIRNGIKILIREGSAAKNFDTMYPLLYSDPDMCMLCSDDKHPDELVLWHINKLVSRAVQKGVPVMNAIRAATFVPVMHYGLSEIGLLRVGDSADFVVTTDLVHFDVVATFVKGVTVALDGVTRIASLPVYDYNRFIRTAHVTTTNLVVPLPAVPCPKINVMGAFDGSLYTAHLKLPASIDAVKQTLVSNVTSDVLKIVVLNRYDNLVSPRVGFINGFGLQRGAIACSIAHDSHNIVAVGVSDADIVAAINKVIDNKGGLAVSNGHGHVTSMLLQVAGLMSTEEGHLVAAKYSEMDALAKSLMSPVKLSAPFMTITFMPLLVIPDLKISDKVGYFSINTFSVMHVCVGALEVHGG